VTNPRVVAEPLGAHHDTAGFDSGRPALDEWLRLHALSTEARGTGRTFVWSEGGRVLAYYTIAAHLAQRDDLPRAVGRGNPAQIPAVLLARLALDKSLQGRGFGSALIVDALGRIIRATNIVGARYIVVDALDEQAASFYLRHGFTRVVPTNRLVLKVSDAEAVLRSKP